MKMTLAKICMLLALLLMGGLAPQAQAAEDGVSLQNVRLGNMGSMKGERINPVYITVVNETEKTFKDANLTLSVPRTVSQFDVYEKIFDVPPYSRLNVSFAIRSFVPKNKKGKRQGSQDPISFKAGLFHEGATLHNDNFYVKPIPLSYEFIMLLDGDANNFGLKRGVNIKGVKSDIKLVYMPPKNLPNLVSEYDGARLVLLGDIDFGKVGLAQRRALLKYISGGGSLIIVPGNNWRALSASFLAPYLPLLYLGEVPIHDNPAPGKLAWDEHIETIGGRWFNNVASADAKVLLEGQGVPILARRRLGNGYVYATALGREVMEATPISLSILGMVASQHRPLTNADKNLNNSAVNLMGEMVGAQIPDRSFVVISVAIYLAVLLVLFGIFIKLKRVEWAWLAMIPASIIFSFVLYSTGLNMTPNQEVGLTHVAMVSGVAGERQANVTGFSTFYTNDDTKVSLTPADYDGWVEKVGVAGKQGHLSLVNYRNVDRQGVVAYAVKPRQLDVFNYRGVKDMPFSLSAKAVTTADGIKVSISHQADKPLTNGFMLLNRAIVPLGTIPAGKELSQLFNDKHAVVGAPNFMGNDLKDDQAHFAQKVMTIILKKQIFGDHQIPKDRILFGAWVASDVMNNKVEPAMASQSRTLILLQIPIEMGKSALFSRGSMITGQIGHRGRIQLQGFDMVEGRKTTKLKYSFKAPGDVNGFKARELKLYVDASGQKYDVACELYDVKSKRYKKIETLSPSGTVVLDAQRYSDEHGVVQARLQFTLNDPSMSVVDLQMAGRLGAWELKEFNISLKGDMHIRQQSGDK